MTRPRVCFLLPCDKAFYVFLVAKDDDRTHADAHDQVGKGVFSEPDQQGHGYRSNDGAHGDHPAHAKCTGKDKDIHQHGQRRQREVNSQGRGHSFAAFESYIDGKAVPEKGSQAYGGNPPFVPPARKSAMQTGITPLSTSPIRVTTPSVLPAVRRTLVAPMLRLPPLPGVDAGQGLGKDQDTSGYGA